MAIPCQKGRIPVLLARCSGKVPRGRRGPPVSTPGSSWACGAPSTSRRERPGRVMSASSVALAREKGARDEAPRRRLDCNVQVLPEILVEAQRHRCVLAGGHVDLKADAGVHAITAGEGKVLAHHGPRARRVRSKGPAQPAAPPEARRQRPRPSPPTIYERGSSIHRPSTAWGWTTYASPSTARRSASSAGQLSRKCALGTSIWL